MDPSAEQGKALESVADWLRGGPQVFRLFGPAGTGKTTLARRFAEGIDGDVHFASFTGKAAYVLRQKGCFNANTIHKLIYLPRSKSAARLLELEEKLKTLGPEDAKLKAQIEKDLREENKNMSRPAFTLNLDSPLRRAKLLVVDEVSMVDEQMGKDLESFGCKILVLGDPAQLPPVYGTGYFINQTPDFQLTEIHRQAKDNPIIRMSMDIRAKRYPHTGGYGDSRVTTEIDPRTVLGADQVLVGRNATRKAWNSRIRELRGYSAGLPGLGDKLVCLRNSQEHPLLNGSLWNVDELVNDNNDMAMTIRVSDKENHCTVMAHKHHFLGQELPWWAKKDAEEFDYGYALTAHKSQGSQWDNVLVYDESPAFRDDRWKWLYTAVTRAAKRVTLVRPS